MHHEEWVGLMSTWVNSVLNCHPAMTAHHVAADCNSNVRPIRNLIRREALRQSRPDVTEEELQREEIPELTDTMCHDHFQSHVNMHEITCVRQMKVVTSIMLDMEMSHFYTPSLEDKRVRLVPTHTREYTRLLHALTSIAKDMRTPNINSVSKLRELLGLSKR